MRTKRTNEASENIQTTLKMIGRSSLLKVLVKQE